MSLRTLELLAPAANAETAIQAILHGADAVYIGAPSHGARKAASNSIDEIRRVVDFAHIYRAKVYVTVNTIIYDRELKSVEAMIWELWRIGVDALIVQDMGVLRLDLPPIELHASTQCDTRTPEKALFLEKAGFSQIVLARELTLSEIRKITDTVSVPVECFIHGALCVSYSGVCHASQVCFGRSANRGECSQLCRMRYSLTDADGKLLSRDAHLLSLKDFNMTDHLEELVEAGVSSFKIEGRLKEISYVKNVTAHYNRLLNRIVAAYPDKYRRESYGRTSITFNPDPEKSFNRGFTTYFTLSRRPTGIFEPRTPKSLGEPVRNVRELHNGDGISWFDRNGEYQGMAVNRLEQNNIVGPKGFRIPVGTEIRRTSDIKWNSQLSGKTAERRLALDIAVDDSGVSATDERGVHIRIPLPENRFTAEKPMDLRRFFEKLGNTPYFLRNFSSSLDPSVFIPASELSECRRRLVETLNKANLTVYPFQLRRKEEKSYPYPEKELTFKANIANKLARRFYEEHGVSSMEDAAELLSSREAKGLQVMTTRHCILRELGLCKKQRERNTGNKKHHPAESRPNGVAKSFKEPLFLTTNAVRFRLVFDCDRCEMNLFEA